MGLNPPLIGECPNCHSAFNKVTNPEDTLVLPGKSLTDILDLWQFDQVGQQIVLKCGHSFCMDRIFNM